MSPLYPSSGYENIYAIYKLGFELENSSNLKNLHEQKSNNPFVHPLF